MAPVARTHQCCVTILRKVAMEIINQIKYDNDLATCLHSFSNSHQCSEKLEAASPLLIGLCALLLKALFPHTTKAKQKCTRWFGKLSKSRRIHIFWKVTRSLTWLLKLISMPGRARRQARRCSEPFFNLTALIRAALPCCWQCTVVIFDR